MKYKTKAQLNWEIGREREIRFYGDLADTLERLIKNVTELEELLVQIRQTEYRRGKEDGGKA